MSAPRSLRCRVSVRLRDMQVRKDLFHLIQLYGRSMNSHHPLHKACTQELAVVFFGDTADRTKETPVPLPDVLLPRLVAWYSKWSKVRP